MRGIERRIAAGRDPAVHSVASLFVSRWDVAVAEMVPLELRNKLGIAVATQTYAAYRELLASAQWQRLSYAGADPQRLLFASTGTKDPAASDVLYVEALAADQTINTMPDATLHAFAAHGQLHGLLPDDGGDADDTLDQFTEAGVEVDALALRLQQEGAAAFRASWTKLLDCITRKRQLLTAA
jgi:transaldolase